MSYPKGLRKLPDTDELLACLNATDQLAMVVRGHQCIELILDHLISDTLPNRHEKLTSRLPFTFKVDLAIGLSAIDPECRPALLQINAIRNRFAHDFDASISETEARELYNTLSPQLHLQFNRKWDEISHPVMCFNRIVCFLFGKLEADLERIRDARLHNQAVIELLNEKTAKYAHLDYASSETAARVEARFRKLKEEQTRQTI